MYGTREKGKRGKFWIVGLLCLLLCSGWTSESLTANGGAQAGVAAKVGGQTEMASVDGGRIEVASVDEGQTEMASEGERTETVTEDGDQTKTASEEEAQEIAVDPTGKREGYSAVLYDNTNGLPTAEANAIAETAEGFIWIGGYCGLIRYDGNTFERMDSTTGIASAISLYVDSRDRLWIGTNDNGVAVMEKGEIKMYNLAEGLKSSSIRSITEDPNGDIYIATTHGIARIGSDMTLHVLDEPQINEAYIRELRTGPDGVIYGVTQERDVFTLQDGRVTAFYVGEKLGIEEIISILPDPDQPGSVYLGTERSKIYHGELKNGLEDAEVLNTAPLTYINSMECYEGQIWACADNGIGTMEEEGFHMLGVVPMNNSVEKMMTDYAGNLWFASSRQGVMKIVPNQFTDVFEQHNLSEEVVNSTCLYGNQLFVGMDSGLVVLGEEGEPESVPIKKAETAGGKKVEGEDLVKMLDGCRIRSIIRDKENRLWISTYSDYALMRYDDGMLTCFTTEDGLPSSRVRTVFERKDGVIMAACSGGVALIQGDRVEEIYDNSAGLGNTEILTVIQAENGDMLFGTDGDGIYVVRDAGITHLGVDSGLGSGIVMRIKKDIEKNIYWLVTSNSIAYMNENYEIVTIKKFPYSNNFDLYENGNGKMWILSSNGIYVVSVEELLKNEEISTVFYNMNNGLPCIATANSYSELTEDGILYIAGSTGVAKVNIKVPFESVNDVKMAVPFVDADEERIYADESGTITIPSKTKKLTIYGFVYTYSLMNPQVTYYLEGFDKNGITVSRNELVPMDYTNLRGGKYHFVMELKDSMGQGHKEMSVLIVKQKAIYEQLWFQIIGIILGLMLLAQAVMLYYRRKIQKLQKKEEENKIFIREMTEAFSKIIDMKDKYTNGHSMRVAEYTSMLATELGYDQETVDKYYNIALLHDIGKIGIPPEVLNKQGKLTDEEFEVIKSHSEMGYQALKDISIMPELAIGAGAHHERPDGKGYPKGLTGDQIPRVAQIIAVADAFDAMYSDRPYRKRMNFDKVVSIIRNAAGAQMAEDVVNAFLHLVEQGKFKDPNDTGGGTMEDIDNIHKNNAS